MDEIQKQKKFKDYLFENYLDEFKVAMKHVDNWSQKFKLQAYFQSIGLGILRSIQGQASFNISYQGIEMNDSECEIRMSKLS